MTADRRADVRVLFGDPAQGTRSLYRQALMASGYTNLREFDSLAGFTDLIAVAQPDVIVMDAALPEGDVARLIAALRHGRLGVNPYLPVIVTTWDGGQASVRRLIDSGADDLLIKPLSTRALLERVEAVGLQRKPFIVTSDYIGPDRRRASARQDSSVPHIEVPNPMGAKLRGEAIDPRAMQQAIQAANEEIARQRLRASAFRIAFVARQILPLYRAGKVPEPATLGLLNEMIASAEDIRDRVKGTELGHIAQICERLLQPAYQLVAEGTTFALTPEWHKPLDLVGSLADAVLALFNPDRAAGDLAAEVAGAIDRFRARRAAQAAGALPGA